ncbi:MAG: hypothetical protein JWO03_2471 [Bacteroidetes bacterium]|nr:hypothetical protein [Bacteroidota bacterium]
MRTNIFVAVFLVILIGACKKETSEPRSKSYTFVQMNNSGITGTIRFIEQADSAQTIVDFELNNTPASRYMAHIHQGPPSSYHGAIYYFDPIYAYGGKISYKQSIPLLYDSAVRLDCTLALHDSTGNQDLGISGVGIN